MVPAPVGGEVGTRCMTLTVTGFCLLAWLRQGRSAISAADRIESMAAAGLGRVCPDAMPYVRENSR